MAQLRCVFDESKCSSPTNHISPKVATSQVICSVLRSNVSHALKSRPSNRLSIKKIKIFFFS